MSSFDGRSVLTLGDSRGIGAAIVRRFAADGVSATFTCSSSPDAAKAFADETGTQTAQTDSADHNAVINRARESDPLDVLVVNAGTILFSDALEQGPDGVERLLRVNTHSSYYAIVEAARQIPDGGHIIIIDPVNDSRMPLAGPASYVVSKPALQGLVRGLARNFGSRGITVGVVQPGPIDTDASPENGPLEEVIHSFMALKRHGHPEEVTGMVAWLVGPEAGLVAGAMHIIDGASGA